MSAMPGLALAGSESRERVLPPAEKRVGPVAQDAPPIDLQPRGRARTAGDDPEVSRISRLSSVELNRCNSRAL